MKKIEAKPIPYQNSVPFFDKTLVIMFYLNRDNIVCQKCHTAILLTKTVKSDSEFKKNVKIAVRLECYKIRHPDMSYPW